MAETAQTVVSKNLVSRLKEGDDVAFNELVNSHWNQVFNCANRKLSNRQDAEEVAQDTFIKARKSIANFRGECSISTWLYRIAINLAHNKYWYWVRRGSEKSVSLDSPSLPDSNVTVCDTIKGEAPDPAKSAITSEFEELVRIAISAIPTKYANVIRLCNEQGLRYDEIAKKLGLSVGTVKSRLARARKMLREELEKLNR